MVEQTRMTAAEFEALPDSEQVLELIEGELIVSPPPIPRHQRTVLRIVHVIEELMPNGEVFIAPIEVYLDTKNIPQPDVLWVAENSQCVITEKRLEGAPDLVVEVFSPGTVKNDRKDKFLVYQQFGVREYGMVDADEEYVEVYRLENGRFTRLGVFEPGESFESTVLGGKSVEIGKVFGH